MVKTIEIPPSPLLFPFVRCYMVKEYNTFGLSVKRPWFASHEFFLAFFLKDKPVELIVHDTGEIITGSCVSPMGISTGNNGIMTYNGDYRLFSINFQPNGFNKLFGIPQHLFTDNIFSGDEVFDGTMTQFFEQLQEAADIEKMAYIADIFLIKVLSKRKNINARDPIAAASGLILNSNGLIHIDKLAAFSNMSFRNFERSFKDQVGTSPKLFARIIRFNYALTQKLKRPDINWTTIALECGYFDQMHFIKDFKQFTGIVPNTFITETAFLEAGFSRSIKNHFHS